MDDDDDDVNNMPTLSVNSLLANLNSRRHQFENCYLWAKWILVLVLIIYYMFFVQGLGFKPL